MPILKSYLITFEKSRNFGAKNGLLSHFLNYNAPPHHGSAVGRVTRGVDFLGDSVAFVTNIPRPKESRHWQAVIKVMMRALKAQHKTNEANNQIFDNIMQVEAESTKDLLLTSTKLNEVIKHVNADYKSLKHAVSIIECRSHAITHVVKIRAVIKKASNIMAKGDSNLLSTFAISPKTLTNLVRRAINNNQELRPVFQPEEIKKYYGLQTAKTIATTDSIITFFRIPMVNHARSFKVFPLHMNSTRTHGDGLLLIRESDHTYRILTHNDYEKATKLDDAIISGLRPAWAHYYELQCDDHGCVVNDGQITKITEVDQVTITYDTRRNSTFKASISCSGRRGAKAITLMPSGTLKIPTACSLESQHLIIAKVLRNEIVINTEAPANLANVSDVRAIAHITPEPGARIETLELDFHQQDSKIKETEIKITASKLSSRRMEKEISSIKADTGNKWNFLMIAGALALGILALIIIKLIFCN